jgi:GntR family transcriptional repressor for pyruvate dehydrogenase complex
LPIQTVETQRLYQQIADQLRELIRRGEFLAGQRLPPERDLARQLGVSRPVVREAMVALEIAGLVEIRTGSGIYVKAVNGAAPLVVLPDVGASPFDVIAARKLLEPEIAFSAAEGISAANLASIAETLEQMREAVAAGRDIKAADRLFHTRIAAATGNTVLVSMGQRVRPDLQRPEPPRRPARQPARSGDRPCPHPRGAAAPRRCGRTRGNAGPFGQCRGDHAGRGRDLTRQN